MFSWLKPSVQMLGRWQPWHDGHTELFKRAYAITGQVCIQVRDVPPVGEEANPLMPGQNDNPFVFLQVKQRIAEILKKEGFEEGIEYIIMKVPNIVDISYGRGVGYSFTEHDLGEEIHNISATEIRKQLREEGKLA